jgi:peptide/nickel transport system substrate-binding protein
MLVVLSLLMAASMLLSACGAAATTAPATQAPAPATAAPATAAPATTAPATAAPTSAPNPYIGSGKLDGNGIPSDFFSDVNIRKGFSYAFDWDTFISDVYKGEAVQSLEIPLPGMPGYDAAAPHYTMDLDKATAAFKASTLKSADGKSVWDVGFRMQMLSCPKSWPPTWRRSTPSSWSKSSACPGRPTWPPSAPARSRS